MYQQIDWDLIRKYDQPGPRYTSYPTAPLFNAEIGADALVEHLTATFQSTMPLSLYVHIPFCHQLCWYCGCNMLVSRNREKMQSHVDLIKREIEVLRPNINGQRETSQIHLGGGTPNYMLDEDLLELMFYLRKTFPISKDAEISMEVDPRHVKASQVSAIMASGFNRISMGVQDFNPEVQKAINRIQPYSMVAEGISMFREAGLNSLNLDLIYGLPKQTAAGFEHTVDQAISLAPERLALFNFAYVPQLKAHMKLIDPADLPEPQIKFQILKRTVEQLTEAGYVYIGMDHFAKPNDPLSVAMKSGDLHRNFQGYTTHAESEMVAFGMSAISMFDSLYVQNVSKISSYEEAIREGQLATWRGYRLNDDDRLRRGIINHFMCNYTIEPDRIEALTGEPFARSFPGVSEKLDVMTGDGLLEKVGNHWKATFLGRMLMRNVAMLFDRYLPAMIEQKQASFSRTV